MTPQDPGRTLTELEGLRLRFGSEASQAKQACLAHLARRRLPAAEEVARLHDVLLFLRAHPDDAEVLARTEEMLQRFDRRGDLRRHRRALDDTGIAGTWLHYSFYLRTARWLVQRFPGRLGVDWSHFARRDLLLERLWLLVSYAEGPALEELGYSLRTWIDLLRGDQTDAEFLVQRLAAVSASPFVREAFYDDLQLPMRLRPDSHTPSRTRARWSDAAPHFQTSALPTGRPNLHTALCEPPPRVRTPRPAQARALVELARGAMVTRARDLNAFMHADWRDVRVFDAGEGLVFAAMGAKAHERLLLESVYAFMMLKNGVPMGYVLASGLFGSSEVAYNVFPPFRGAQAAHTYARALAAIRALFGSTVFSVDPYQLGYGNQEGLASGAWWFYYKLGFRPLDPDIRALVRRERAAIRRDPRHRTDPDTLEKMAADYMFLFTEGTREDVMGRLDLGAISLGASQYVVQRFGADRERAVRICAEEAGTLLGVRTWTRWTAGEREAWRRWAPLVMALPGVARWGRASRRALAAVIRAKGGVREVHFVHQFNAHQPLRRALLRLGASTRATMP